MERLHSTRYPAMYSPAAVLPWVAPRIAVKLSPRATHASVQSAAVLAWTSRWPRPNTRRSTAVSTGTAAMRAIHAQSGGFTRAGPSGRWGYRTPKVSPAPVWRGRRHRAVRPS